MPKQPIQTSRPAERVLLCGLVLPDQAEEPAGALTEAAGLVEAAGSEVVGEGIVQRRASPDAATLLGRGKVAEVKEAIARSEPDAVVVDNDLTPAQVRNLEKAWGKRVVDRSELIMDIFARRAQTRQSRLQVELAQTQYLLPRLRRMWTHLERTEGAIGTRGPGETQLETDRRLIKKRILDLRRELSEIERRKQRQVLSRDEQFTVGLVGYTNAGKSTLLNRLTGAHEVAADMLFATLDTRTRRWRLSDGRTVLLSDTVGFLDRLPHHLVASFQATLEEALNVDLLLHVVDAADPAAAAHIAAVDAVLAGAAGGRRDEILVWNKVDAVSRADGGPGVPAGVATDRESVAVSARTGLGLAELERAVADRLDRRSALVELTIPFSEGASLAMVRRTASVLHEEHDAERGTIVVARIPDRELGNLERAAAGRIEVNILEPAREHYLPLEREADPA